MDIELAKKSDEQLKALIQNHRDKMATDRPIYVEALRELQRRKGKGLNFDKSFEIIKRAAAEGRFVSYKELADASGAEWTQVHYSIGAHLWGLVEYAHLRGWPMLSAIVVNKHNVETGHMEPATLKGFISAARDLGYPVSDGVTFLKEQQERVFDWAKSHGQQKP